MQQKIFNIIMISLLFLIIIIMLYDKIKKKQVEKFEINEEGAKKIGIYNAIQVLKNIEENGKIKIKELEVDKINIMPYGTIIMWNGEKEKIPTGWSLCDGNNGTPDLRNRFIVGAGSAYNKGATGGADTVTLSINQIPSHRHRTETKEWGRSWQGENGAPNTAYFETYDNNINGKYTDYVGGGQAHENRPPYYALYYIMRTQQ